MRRLLVIDDEAQIRRLIMIALSSKGWEVFEAPTAFEGLQSVQAAKPDVVLLDLNLPDSPGLEALKRLREWSTVPVIVISVRNAEADIVASLNSGADDYVVKPFYTGELIARIEAAHRRRMPELEPVFRSGDLVFDAEHRLVESGGEAVRLTPTEYSVLEILVRHSGKIVTRERFQKEIWGPAGENEEGSLRVFINALRKKIERDPAHPRLIVTESGVGYRLSLLPVQGGADAADDGLALPPQEKTERGENE
jgi:two-component system KDP operon response regulator KdpE